MHAALESGLSAASSVLNQNHRRIGIIGAGVAGLAAAHALSQQGREVEVIEARSRIGGSIHTDTSLGFAADLGASWLHGAKGNPLSEVTQRAGMRKFLSKEAFVVRSGGKKVNVWSLPGWVSDVLSYDNHAGTAKGTLNTWAYLWRKDYKGDEFLFPDGYSQLLNNYVGNYRISLNQQVTSISYTNQSAGVETADDRTNFDAIIVTVPLGVLKSDQIKFSPSLPLAKLQAIKRLGFGLLDKVYL